MITGVSHIYISAKDTDETVTFYTENLGFTLFRRWSMPDGRKFAYVSLGDILLEVGGPVPGEQSGGPSDGTDAAKFGIVVQGGLDAQLDTLRQNGVEVLPESPTPPRSFQGRQVRVKDPSGWLVALREWRAPDGPHYSGWQPEP